MGYKRNRYPTGLPSDNSNYKKRECLKCGKLFGSHSVGNRICPSCQFINSKLASYTGPRSNGVSIHEEQLREDTD